ncbi:MAG TPA: hypothetical protein VGJ14_00005, partial [Sporichthyaceae bacterium]
VNQAGRNTGIVTAPVGTARLDQPNPRPSSRRIAWTVLRVVVSIAVLGTLYYRLPLDHTSAPVAVTVLLVGLAGFIALIGYQVWLILRSPFPGLRAAEALATSVPFFLLLFAATYVAGPRQGRPSRRVGVVTRR